MIYEHEGIDGLALAVMKEEIDQRLTGKKGLYAEDTEWATKIMRDILLSTDSVLLESILYGNLALDRQQSPHFENVLGQLKEQAVNQPGIY